MGSEYPMGSENRTTETDKPELQLKQNIEADNYSVAIRITLAPPHSKKAQLLFGPLLPRMEYPAQDDATNAHRARHKAATRLKF